MNIKKISARQDLLDFVVKQNGAIEFSKPLFPNSWQIQKIKAVYFNEQFDIDEDDENATKWNCYVDKIRNAIGVNCYCDWVRNKDWNVVGIMAFYNAKGEEIKVKHFEEWFQLWENVNNYNYDNIK